MIRSFPELVKHFLSDIPDKDYPVLNSRLFSCWFAYVMDKSVDSLQALCKRLNNTNKEIHISTFSKATKRRSQNCFKNSMKKYITKYRGKFLRVSIKYALLILPLSP